MELIKENGTFCEIVQHTSQKDTKEITISAQGTKDMKRDASD
jgi:hypothetical protein